MSLSLIGSGSHNTIFHRNHLKPQGINRKLDLLNFFTCYLFSRHYFSLVPPGQCFERSGGPDSFKSISGPPGHLYCWPLDIACTVSSNMLKKKQTVFKWTLCAQDKNRKWLLQSHLVWSSLLTSKWGLGFFLFVCFFQAWWILVDHSSTWS